MSTGPSPARSNRPALIGLGGAGLAAVLACLCLAAVAIVALINYRTFTTAADEPTVAYILDASPRMELTADSGGGKTRINVAEAVLAEVIRPAEPSLTMGLRVFGTGNPFGVGIRMTALKLIVSADGLTLAGTWYDDQSRSDKPVSIKRLSSP